MGLLKEAVINKKVKPNKIDRATDYIVRVITSKPGCGDGIEFKLGAKPKGSGSQEFLNMVSEEALRTLASHGIGGWSVDMAASQDASRVSYGYGNQANAILNSHDLHLVLARVSQLPQLAEVMQLPVRSEPEPMAA